MIGKNIVMKLHTVIGDKEIYSMVFSINLLDLNNDKHTIQAFAVLKICDIQVVSSDGKVETRPSGKVVPLVVSHYIG